MQHRATWIAIVTAAIAFVPRAIADAPPGHYVVDAVAGTVRDTKTQLTWQRAVQLGDGGSNVPRLEDAGYLCVAPWRLPSIKELATLVDETAVAPPFIDEKAFPNTPAIAYWSSTLSNADPEDYQSYVLRPDGTIDSVYYNGAGFGGGIVRCVRP